MLNFEPQKALLHKFFERRHVELFESSRQKRSAVAARRAADGTLNSGGFVTDVTSVYATQFEELARGLTTEVLDLFARSQLQINVESASWIKAELEPLFSMAAMNLRAEAGEGRVLRDELRASVNQAMDKSLNIANRDLQIELDLRLITKPALAAAAAGAVAALDDALMDVLVPLQNLRGLKQTFSQQTTDPNGPLTLVTFDIDRFKDVNDKQGGHAIGNEALLSIAETAAACTRGKGAAFRIGGDEFVLLLQNHTLQEGLAVAERFRREVNGRPRTSQSLTLSVSVGVAIWPEHGSDLDALLKAGDAALYDAKRRNRNLVRYFGEPEPSTTNAVGEPERKQPEAGELSHDEQLRIRQDYFRLRMARCPRDEALLDVADVTAMGQSTRGLIVSCPLCGLSAELD